MYTCKSCYLVTRPDPTKYFRNDLSLSDRKAKRKGKNETNKTKRIKRKENITRLLLLISSLFWLLLSSDFVSIEWLLSLLSFLIENCDVAPFSSPSSSSSFQSHLIRYVQQKQTRETRLPLTSKNVYSTRMWTSFIFLHTLQQWWTHEIFSYGSDFSSSFLKKRGVQRINREGKSISFSPYFIFLCVSAPLATFLKRLIIA